MRPIDGERLHDAALLSGSKLHDRTQEQGLCAADPKHADDWFLPEPQATSTRARASYEREAERLCGPCPVRAECLELALRTEADRLGWGVWGGLAPWQRRRLVDARRRAAGSDAAVETIRALTEAA
jgi:hypothetical protein